MEDQLRSRLVDETVTAYLEFSDFLRLATLPSWVNTDLTISQVKAIALLAHHGALAVGELAELLGIGNPATSILVQQLVEQQLVKRSEDVQDRRRTLVSLTEQGLRLISGQREQREARLRQLMSQLDDEEIVIGFQRGIKRLIEVMQTD